MSECKTESGTASLRTDSQWSKQEACFACATRVWFAVNDNTSDTSGEWVWCLKRSAQASELGSCQSKLCNSWGYDRLQKSKDLLKDCFENVNFIKLKEIHVQIILAYLTNQCLFFSKFYQFLFSLCSFNINYNYGSKKCSLIIYSKTGLKWPLNKSCCMTA